MDNNGWIKLHRKILGWEWYDDINVFRLFIHLILVANHEDAQWHGIPIRRGQHLTSLSKLSQESKLSVRQVRVALTKLKTTREVTSESTPKYTVITILNYGEYQRNDTQNDKRMTNWRQGRDKVMTTNKKEEKEEKEKKDINIYCVSFEKFWERYPRRIGKRAAYQVYLRLTKRDRSLEEKIMVGLEKQLPVLLDKEPRYIPHPTTWLNQGRWEDDTTAPRIAIKTKAPAVTWTTTKVSK